MITPRQVAELFALLEELGLRPSAAIEEDPRRVASTWAAALHDLTPRALICAALRLVRQGARFFPSAGALLEELPGRGGKGERQVVAWWFAQLSDLGTEGRARVVARMRPLDRWCFEDSIGDIYEEREVELTLPNLNEFGGGLSATATSYRAYMLTDDDEALDRARRRFLRLYRRRAADRLADELEAVLDVNLRESFFPDCDERTFFGDGDEDLPDPSSLQDDDGSGELIELESRRLA
jgi:hypothetical protein